MIIKNQSTIEFWRNEYLEQKQEADRLRRALESAAAAQRSNNERINELLDYIAALKREAA